MSFLSFHISYVCFFFHSPFLLFLLSSFFSLVYSLTSFFPFLLSSPFHVLLILSSLLLPSVLRVLVPCSGPPRSPSNQRTRLDPTWCRTGPTSTRAAQRWEQVSALISLKKACAGLLNSSWACVCFRWWRYQSGFRGIKRSVVRRWNAETSLLTATLKKKRNEQLWNLWRKCKIWFGERSGTQHNWNSVITHWIKKLLEGFGHTRTTSDLKSFDFSGIAAIRRFAAVNQHEAFPSSLTPVNFVTQLPVSDRLQTVLTVLTFPWI